MKKQVSENAKMRMKQVFNQAKGSLKILETLEKETMAKAKSLVRSIPTGANRRRLTNDKIKASLHKFGFATQSELELLQERIERLENLLDLQTKNSPETPKKKKSTSTAHSDSSHSASKEH